MTRLLVCCCVVLAACSASSTGEQSTTLLVEVVDTLVAAESAAIAYAVDLDVAPSGTVYVADFMANALLAVDTSGAVTVLGREGAGPGEFAAPWAIRALNNDLLVVDRGNGRVQRLAEDGSFLGSSPVPPAVMRATPYVLPNGRLLIGTNGSDSALVVEFDTALVRSRTFGSPVTQVPAVRNFASIKARINEGAIPDEIRNEALVAALASGDVWVALVTEGEVRRYDERGTLRWSTSIDEPEMAVTLEDFYARNAAEENPSRFYPLRYFRDLEAVGDDLWILLDTPPSGPAVVVVLDSEGGRAQRIEIVGAGGAMFLAADPERGVLYLSTPHDAQLLRARVRRNGAVGAF